MGATGEYVSTSPERTPKRPNEANEVTVGDSQDRNYGQETGAVDNRSLVIPDGARLCKQLDGCCYTHSPCFEIADDNKAQPCSGWPCPYA